MGMSSTIFPFLLVDEEVIVLRFFVAIMFMPKLLALRVGDGTLDDSRGSSTFDPIWLLSLAFSILVRSFELLPGWTGGAAAPAPEEALLVLLRLIRGGFVAPIFPDAGEPDFVVTTGRGAFSCFQLLDWFSLPAFSLVFMEFEAVSVISGI